MLQVTVGLRLSEQVLWSSQTTLAASAALQLQAASNRGMALSAGDTLHLVVEGVGPDGTAGTWLHKWVASHLSHLRAGERWPGQLS